MPRKYNHFLRGISVLLVGAFCLQEVSWAMPETVGATGWSPLQIITQDPTRFEVPVDFYSLKEIHKGASDTLIIHIQDAHANYSGQQNLSKTLDELMKTYGISMVLVLAMDVSLDSGLTLIKPERDKIIAILVAIITAADAKRGVDPLITERRMRYLTGDGYLKLSKYQAGYLAKIPSDFAQNKEERLNAIYVPLAIKALNLIGEQIIGYAKMMLAVGSSA